MALISPEKSTIPVARRKFSSVRKDRHTSRSHPWAKLKHKQRYIGHSRAQSCTKPGTAGNRTVAHTVDYLHLLSPRKRKTEAALGEATLGDACRVISSGVEHKKDQGKRKQTYSSGPGHHHTQREHLKKNIPADHHSYTRMTFVTG